MVGVSDRDMTIRIIGDCGSAVVNPNGSSRKEKKKKSLQEGKSMQALIIVIRDIKNINLGEHKLGH